MTTCHAKPFAGYFMNLLIIVALSGLIAPAPTAGSTAEVPLDQPQAVHTIVFPDVAGGYNGMKVGYTVTGATLGQPQDSGSSLRYYQGRLGTGTLTVSGWVEQNNGYGADLSVSVTVGGREERYDDSGSTPWRQEFSVSVPIPPGETKGEFSIMVTGSYNAGDRTLFVGADFAPENVVPVTVSGQAYTPLQRVDSDRGFPAAVRSSWRAPLAGVAVDLVRLGPGSRATSSFKAGQHHRRTGWGQYTFPNVPVTTSLAISVGLQSAGLAVWDASASPANYSDTSTAHASHARLRRLSAIRRDRRRRRHGRPGLWPRRFLHLPGGRQLAAGAPRFLWPGLLSYGTGAAIGGATGREPRHKTAARLRLSGRHEGRVFGEVPILQGAMPGFPRTSSSAARPRMEASHPATSTTAVAPITANGTNSAIISWPMPLATSCRSMGQPGLTMPAI